MDNLIFLMSGLGVIWLVET